MQCVDFSCLGGMLIFPPICLSALVGNVSARVILRGCKVSFVVCIHLCSDQVRAGPLCKEKGHLGARTQRRSGQKFVLAAWISLFLGQLCVCVCACVFDVICC